MDASDFRGIINDANEALNELNSADNVAYEAVIDIIENNTNNGNVLLSDKAMSAIEDIITKSLNDTALFGSVKKYLTYFNIIENAFIDRMAKHNSLKVDKLKKMWSEHESGKAIINRTKYALSKQGVYKSYTNTIANLVREQSYYNQPLKTAKKLLKQTIIENGIMPTYVNQVATDSIRQYNGAFSDAVRKEYGFNEILWIGDLLETTRPFCYKILTDFNGKISINEMKKLLQEYCPNGQPSKDIITIDSKNKRKGDGMYKDTTINNICKNAGGFACLHDPIPTR